MWQHSNLSLLGQEGQPHVISLTSCDTSEPTNGTEPGPQPGQHQPQQNNGLERKLEDSLRTDQTGDGKIEKTDITVENGGGGGGSGGGGLGSLRASQQQKLCRAKSELEALKILI